MLRISEDAVYRDVGGEIVILNLATGTYFGLDDVGARMWMLLAESGSPDRVVEALLAEYEVDEAQLRADLDGFIAALRDKGLVHVAP